MLKGETKTGFKFEILDEALDDWEVLECLSDLEENPQGIIKVARLLLDQKQYKALKEHCKVNGHVKMSLMSNEISDIFESNSTAKKY